MTSKEKAEKSFPRLDIKHLRSYSVRWLRRWKESRLQPWITKWSKNYPGASLSIDRIVLYHRDATKYQPSMDFIPPIKYVVVFEISGAENLSRPVPRLDEDQISLILGKVQGKTPTFLREELDNFLGNNSSIRHEDHLYPELMSADFENVYKQELPNSYRKEWRFISKAEDEPLSSDIRTDEPHVILFEGTAKNSSETKTSKRQCVRDKEKAREIAEREWKTDGKNPRSRSEMAKHSEIANLRKKNGKPYTDKTRVNWIRDLL